MSGHIRTLVLNGFLALSLVATLYPALSLAEPLISAHQLDTYLSGKCAGAICSPLAGHGSVFVTNGLRFDVDPRLVVAIAGAETTFGTNMGCNADFNAWSWFWNTSSDCHDNPLDSWDAGIHGVTRQMWLYFTRDRLSTISQIGAKYCAEDCEHWVPNVSASYHDQLGGDLADLGFFGFIPYDDFASTQIDGNKWSPINEIRTSTSVRAIENGELRLTSMTGNIGDVITTTLRFTSPATIRGYLATVSVDQIGTGFADNQVARLIGSFYKSFGGFGGVGFDGDIIAAMRITGNQASGLQASFTMFRCMGIECASSSHIFFDFLDPVAIGSQNTLFLLWDGSKFSYGVNGTIRTFNPNSVAPVVSQVPGLQFKSVDTQAFFSGSVSATFDDVFVAR